MKKKSLKKFLFYRLVLMIIFPMFLMSSTAIIISVKSIRESIEKRNAAVVTLINYFLKNSEETLMQVERMISSGHIRDKNKHLDIMVKNYVGLKKIQILDLDGVVRYSSGGDPDVGYDMSNFKFIENTLNGKSFYWSGSVLLPGGESPVIMLAKKIDQYILVGYVNAQELNRILVENAKNIRGKMAVLDNDGNLILSSIDDMTSERKNSLRYLYMSMSQNEASGKTNFIKGKSDIIQNYTRLENVGWTILFTEEAGRSFIFMWDFYKHIVVVLGILTLIIITSSYAMLKKLLGDVSKLKLISEKVSDGELPEIKGYEILETKDLADKFLKMGKIVLERERNIKEKAWFLKTLLDTIPSPVFYKNKEHVYLGCNEAFAKYIGIKKEEFPGKTVYDVSPKDKAEIYKKADTDLLETGGTQIYQAKVVDADGNSKDVNFYKSVYRGLNGEKEGIIGVMLDVTNLQNALRTSKKKEKFIESLLYTVPLPIFYQDRDGKYLNCNKAFEEVVGKLKEEIIGEQDSEVWGLKYSGYCTRKDEKTLKDPNLEKFECKIPDKDGEERTMIFHKTVFYTEDSDTGGVIGVISDVTEFKKLQEELRKISVKDGLTRIYNRRGFEELSKSRWKEALRYKKSVSVIMLDIDNFKLYNDYYGHQPGDKCLREIAEELEDTCKRPSDIVARYGGEEFIVFLFDADINGAKEVAESIRRNIEKLNIKNEGSGKDKNITVSLGVASHIPKDGKSLDKLIEKADKLLYKAKKHGKNRVEI